MRTQTTGFPSSTFCHSPAAVGSAAAADTVDITNAARAAAIGCLGLSLDRTFRIIIIPRVDRAMNEDYGHFTDGARAADGLVAQFSRLPNSQALQRENHEPRFAATTLTLRPARVSPIH